MTCKSLGRVRPFVVLFSLCLAAARADTTVNFNTADPGVIKSIPNWGLDTNWASLDNMKRGLIFMGPENVNVVRVPGLVDKPVDGGLTADQKATLNQSIALAGLAGPNAKWDMCAPGSTVDPSYQSGVGSVYADRWAKAMQLNQQYYNHTFWMLEPFNEPDYAAWGEGSKQNLYDILGYLKTAPEFAGTGFAGGSTMSTDQAKAWYDALGNRAAIGTTHCLYGTVANYVDFIQHVTAANGTPVNPEGHNVVEAIIGANYGLNGVIWWGTAELTRGQFVRASNGVRLGYAEDWPNWTAAAVYRSPSGAVQAFLGSGERVGGTTTYTFHCTDRDVYFDGHGPQRDYTVTIARNQERVINITWGPDQQPVNAGRYVLVNKRGLCLGVTGASTASAATLEQNAYAASNAQLWDVSPLPATAVGDISYFLLQNVNSGLYADMADWKYDDEAPVKQYNYPDNEVERWYFVYVGNGYFAIRNRWCDKALSVSSTGSALGARIVQRTFTGTDDQLWRLQDPATMPASDALQISSQPQSCTAAPGQTMTFNVAATGTGALSYQWRLNGTAIAGETNPRLVLANVQAANAGTYSVVVTDVNGSVTSADATLTVQSTADVGRLINLSIRSMAGTGDQTLIAGFVVGGPSGSKPVLVRATGPALTAFNVSGVLADPNLEIISGGVTVTSNDDWGTNAAEVSRVSSAVGAFPLTDLTSKDAAIATTMNGGLYSAKVTGVGGTTGIALVELFDATPSDAFDIATTPRLINTSARALVGTGDNVLIAGFVIGGSTARTVLIRATGPALAAYGMSGTLAATRLDLVHKSQTIATNIGWGGDAQITAVSNSVNAFPLTNSASKDSALLVTLPPGLYSAKVSGTDGGTGVALVEVYEVP